MTGRGIAEQLCNKQHVALYSAVSKLSKRLGARFCGRFIKLEIEDIKTDLTRGDFMIILHSTNNLYFSLRIKT